MTSIERGGISIAVLIVIFCALWILGGKQKRKHEDLQRKLRQSRKEQLAKLKAKKLSEKESE